MSRRDASVTLTAECNNCAAWVRPPLDPNRPTTAGPGYCGKGLAPPAGELLCSKYEASASFKQQIISAMLKEEGPMAMPVKLIGGRESAKKFQKRARGGGNRRG